ncbi:hypothetical protein [Mesorhizobium sp. LNJC391B00]|uniref:hypothetical protein n=1 Tax=Mesorhizobium sp. LNJC391B00 TaxID=1287273 RepID=UPI0012EBA3B8|nr:hypothetical protein [Mesorhizobium sp. LNJC391B00]
MGLPTSGEIDDIYIAASLRRLAGFMCPCSPKTLIGSMVDSHRFIKQIDNGLLDRIESVLESLVAIGDLLELSDVTTLDETVKSTWVFTAPPSFVPHPAGSAFLLGVSADEATPLPVELRIRIKYRGVARSIDPTPLEALETTLRGMGLRELSMESWLRHPKVQSETTVLRDLDAKLSAQGPCGEIVDLRILDHTRNARRYRDRWGAPISQSGRFIVRRAQAYGADLWGYAELREGKPAKLIDFPPPGLRWRGCDMAWRVQMAIDSLAGNAQRFSVEVSKEVARIDFFSPIPDWARRRLSTIGEQAEPRACLLSFLLPEKDLNSEEQFLRDHLFLDRADA